MVDIARLGGTLLILAGLVAAHESGHFLAGIAVGIPRKAMRIVFGVPRSHVALRGDGEWIDPNDRDRYVAVYRGYVPGSPWRLRAFVYGAGGFIGETATLILVVLALGRYESTAWVALSAVAWSLISTAFYVLVDLVETHRNQRPAGDTTALWTISPAGTVSLLVTVLAADVGLLLMLG